MEIWSPGWGQPSPAAVNQCRPTLRCSAIKFSPLWFWTKEKGGRGRGSLPEPRTLVKGNYILIPFRNLVYIWLPGTSANCLQCLFFVFTWSVCTSFSASALCHTNTHTHTHTHTHRQDCRRLWLAQNTTHAGVITMQVDYSNYCVNSIVFPFGFLFCFFPQMTNTARWTGVMLLTVRLASQLMWNSNRAPLYL